MDIEEKLVQKLFHNQCSKDELEFLFQLILNDNLNIDPKIINELGRQMGNPPEVSESMHNRMLDKVLEGTTHREILQSEKQVKLNKFSSYTKMIIGSAAAILILVCGTVAFNFIMNENVVWTYTDYGETKEIALPDNSVIILNGNSSVHYASDWVEGESRKVYLEGEAYFQIEKKPVSGENFQVITNDLTVEVLGTSFNVNTHNSQTEVFLDEGKLKVDLELDSKNDLYLKPGEYMNYSATQQRLILPQKVEKELVTSWRSGILTFKDTSLEEILSKLRTSMDFNYSLVNRNLIKRKYTLSLPLDNIEQAMAVLKKTTGSTISITGEQYIITQN